MPTIQAGMNERLERCALSDGYSVTCSAVLCFGLTSRHLVRLDAQPEVSCPEICAVQGDGLMVGTGKDQGMLCRAVFLRPSFGYNRNPSDAIFSNLCSAGRWPAGQRGERPRGAAVAGGGRVSRMRCLVQRAR